MKKKNIPVEEPDFTDVFFKEVSEDVHNDNLKAFWKKYGVQIVAFMVICLTLAVSFETIKHWREKQNQKWSDGFAYAQVLKQQGNVEESLKVLKDIQNRGNTIYSDIARLETINISFEQGKKDEALKELEAFIKAAGHKKMRDAALIKLASYKADTLSSEEMTKLLEPLSENEAWALEAKELVALCLLKEGKKEKALELYDEIVKAHEVHDNLRARAQNMISVLTNSGE